STDYGIFRIMASGDVLFYCLMPTTVFDHACVGVEDFLGVAISLGRALLQAASYDHSCLLKAPKLAIARIFSNRGSWLGKVRAWTYPHCRSIGDAGDNACTVN